MKAKPKTKRKSPPRKPRVRPTSIHTHGYKALVDFVVDARKQAGLTQEQLADKMGFQQSHVSKIEQLERRADIHEILDLLYALADDNESVFKKYYQGLLVQYFKSKRKGIPSHDKMRRKSSVRT